MKNEIILNENLYIQRKNLVEENELLKKSKTSISKEIIAMKESYENI